jgi:hypothetical protein
VLGPELACIFQTPSNVVLLVSGKVLDLTEDGIVIQVANILLQLLLHELRHASRISAWRAAGSTTNFLSSQRFGSMRKSGNDLWKILNGIFYAPWYVEERMKRSNGILIYCVLHPRRAERSLIERGLKRSKTAPTTVWNRRYGWILPGWTHCQMLAEGFGCRVVNSRPSLFNGTLRKGGDEGESFRW